VDQLTFRRDWLVGTRGLDPRKVGLVFIRGDSMYPTLWSGDLVMVDTTRKGIHGGGLYVIRMGEGLMAKRLHRWAFAWPSGPQVSAGSALARGGRVRFGHPGHRQGAHAIWGVGDSAFGFGAARGLSGAAGEAGHTKIDF
jgi:hypothetical protein